MGDAEAPCGVYYNAEDERVCVCARDPAQCGKRTPAANLATCAGKLICLVLVGAIVGVFVTITMLRIDGSKGEPDEREGRRMLEAVLELVEARR